MLAGFFIALGIYALAYYLYDNLRSPVCFLYNTWLQRHKRQEDYLMEAYGKWAAITGSTDGIGKAYAKELARLGFNIVLISRSAAKLEQVAQEIETEFAVETFTVQCDFSKGAEVYSDLFTKLSQRPIGIMINNVGIAHDPGTISTFSAQHVWDVININIGAATQLSRHFIYKWQMAGARGLLVNISSGLELQPCPFGSVYAASKAYIRSFTKALQTETKDLGIAVQLCSPNLVLTKINNYSKKIMQGGNAFIPRPDEFAKWAVGTLGKVDETTGYFWHGVQTGSWKILPDRLKDKLLPLAARFFIDDIKELRPHLY